MIKTKRVYEKPDKNDGVRILVDRLWPRGLTKEKAKIGKWFAHKEGRWQEFIRRYQEELKNKKNLLNELKEVSKNAAVTLLFAAKDEERNNARILLGLLKEK